MARCRPRFVVLALLSLCIACSSPKRQQPAADATPTQHAVAAARLTPIASQSALPTTGAHQGVVSRLAAADTTITVDAAVKDQRIDGFGSSQRIWGDPHLAFPIFRTGSTSVPARNQEEILTKLYGELGLTRARVHGFCGFSPPATGARPANPTPVVQFQDGPIGACPVSAPPPGPDTAGTINASSAFVRQAMRSGLRTVVMLNNIPSWINRSNPEAYAENTLALLLYTRDQQGFAPAYVVLQNEPALYADGWPDGEWHRDVIKALGPQMRAAGLTTTVVLPDDLNASATLRRIMPVLADPEARRYIGAIATHLYGDGLRDNRDLQRLRDLSREYDIPLWMTEFTVSGQGWSGAFAWAEWMQELLGVYRFSAVDYMWGFMGDWVNQQFNEQDYIQIKFDPQGRYLQYEPTPLYYVAGQWTRFVRPGANRIDARTSNASVRVTAFLHPDDGTLTLVVINEHENDVTVDLRIENLSLDTLPTVYRTSESERWTPLPSVRVAAGGAQLSLRARSVTTLTTAK